MKNTYKIIIGIVIAIIISVLIYFATRPKTINKFTFPSTLVVTNNTSYKALDTIAMVAINKILLYNTINVDFYIMPLSYSTEDIQIIGFIRKNPFKLHTYMIFIEKETDVTSVITFISHELTHIKQMEEGRLIELSDTISVFNGDTINFHKVPYDERAYEIEAFANQGDIERMLNKLLYQKL